MPRGIQKKPTKLTGKRVSLPFVPKNMEVGETRRFLASTIDRDLLESKIVAARLHHGIKLNITHDWLHIVVERVA